MLRGVHAELLQFCQPWLHGEPRLLLACQFAPEGRGREQFLAVNVLMRELAQSVIAVSERRVAEARLAWWADEAQSWVSGHPRHPLAHGFDYRNAGLALSGLVAACGEWLMASAPEQAQALHQRLQVLAKAVYNLHPGAAAWRAPWLALLLRMTLSAHTPLTSVVPLDLWARHGIKRSQWPDLDHARRGQVLADVVTALAIKAEPVAIPALAALQHLESRWLACVSRSRPEGDRIGLRDAFGAWRAACRVG